MEFYNHFAYGLSLTQSMALFQPEVAKAFHKAPNSDTLVSISNKLSDINYPVLVAVDGKDSTFDDNEAESLIKKQQYFFMLLKPANNEDPDAILAAQELCEANALQIQVKLNEDRLKFKLGLSGLQLGSFSIASIGPLGDNLYGVIMGFQLHRGISTKIIPEFWVPES